MRPACQLIRQPQFRPKNLFDALGMSSAGTDTTMPKGVPASDDCKLDDETHHPLITGSTASAAFGERDLPTNHALGAEQPQDNMTKAINRRVVVHFPGFEPMTARAHHGRFKRSVQFSSKVWAYTADVSPLADEDVSPNFTVSSDVEGWKTSTTVHLCDHKALLERLTEKPILHRMLAGFLSAAQVVFYGAAAGYFRHAWRFGLFFVFPFLLMGLALAACLFVAATPFWLDLRPWHYGWSIPLAWLCFHYVLFPLSERFLILHLFADWQLAVSAARLDDPDLAIWLEQSAVRLAKALDEPADEYVISSHSMGSTLAAHVFGMVLENNPALMAGKKVVFLTLGGAILQCALLRPAARLRARVGAIARMPDVSFVEVHCLTDVIHFYKCPVVSLCGHPDAPQAEQMYIRVKQLLEPERYKRIKRDFLRVHRQYVLYGDRRGTFDFSLLTVSPFPAHRTDDVSKRDFTTLEQG
ncbi:hypothetical protein [Shinella kummerowiae]|jgi:hypothetical protein|nr:hypothetical protein [Shinella kummerowiae]